MNLAKISANGQVTVPAEIRRLLGFKSGDKILFFQKQDGEVVISNASTQGIHKSQAALLVQPKQWESLAISKNS